MTVQVTDATRMRHIPNSYTELLSYSIIPRQKELGMQYNVGPQCAQLKANVYKNTSVTYWYEAIIMQLTQLCVN